ncbi:MAG: SAM-dependent methyltransferase [Aeoliella sp.]
MFARTRAESLGRVSHQTLAESVQSVWQLEGVRELIASQRVGGLHVWQRDSRLPGEGGFEPAITPLAEEVRKALVIAAPKQGVNLSDNSVAPQGVVVLDVVLVEPGEWYVGWHSVQSRTERWPGGMLPVAAPENAISRAYLKMEEALKWSAIPSERGDLWVELGCAPGGSCQALVDRGYSVLGIDPAEVEEPLASHPRFQHLRKRAAEVRRAELAEAKWLAADLNVAPQYTLDAVEEIVTHPANSIRGLVLTLKLASWELGTPEQLRKVVERIRSWGFRDVRLRQLVHNRRELCLVALPSRGQRRMTRRRRSHRSAPRDSQTTSQIESTEDVRFDAPIRLVPRHHFR